MIILALDVTENFRGAPFVGYTSIEMFKYIPSRLTVNILAILDWNLLKLMLNQKAMSSNNNLTDLPTYAVIQQINQADVDYLQSKKAKFLKSFSLQ